MVGQLDGGQSALLGHLGDLCPHAEALRVAALAQDEGSCAEWC